jgi:hypothetical protein
MCHNNECGCGHHRHHALERSGHHHQGCGCDRGYLPRHFPTREETIARLEGYLKDLRAEVTGLEEHIAELKKAG